MTWRRHVSGQRLGVSALALLAYLPALLAAPGKMPADTKLYLYLDPGRLISDSVYTWDNRQFAGWVPHQTVTYLWPSGPWYWLFDHLGVPDWVAHRLWIATILFCGGLGVRWAAKHLGLAGIGALTAALVYQLSPYVLPYLSRTSLMLLPWAAVGWLVGLTVRAATRSVWRDAAIFALVIVTVGSPNATALAMIAPAPVLWLLHAAWQRAITWRRAVAAAARLGGLSLAVSLWWVAMLAVQAGHGADVLSYSETLEAVSFTSVSTETLRGLGYWLFYIRDPFGFATSESRHYLEAPVIIFAGFALVVCCIAGIVLTRWSQRRYAAMLVFVGIVLAVGVHPIASSSPLMSRVATSSRSSLSLAIRSSTRALPVSNFGLALGAGALACAVARLLNRHRPRVRLLAPAVIAVLAIVNMPALFDGGFVDPAISRRESPPAAWRQAAAALDAGSPEYRVLQLPGAEFGAYRWGYTVDPPLPGLTTKPLITRDLLPLGSPGAMDLLYALDDRAQSGTIDPRSIAPVARLLAADTVFVSNDMAFDRFRTPRPELTDAMFAAQPLGLTQPERFGTPTPNDPQVPMVDETALAHREVGEPVPPVELIGVDQPVPMVRASTHTVVVAGSGDGLVDAAGAGLLHGDEAVLYAANLVGGDDLAKAGMVILTDSNRDRAHQWRGTQDVLGFTETGGPQRDLLQRDTADQRLPVFAQENAADQTTAHVDGLDVRATSYGEPFAYRPEDRPAMAVDGDPRTAWVVSDRADPIGQRIEAAGDVSGLSLLQSQQLGASRMISRVRLDFDNGPSQTVDLDESSLTGSGQRVDVPSGAGSVRITILAVTDRPGATDPGPSAVGFAELGLGAHPEVVALPTDLTNVPADMPLAVVMTRLRTDPLDRWRSDPETRLIRAFSLNTARSFDTTVTLHRNDRAADALLDGLAGVDTATSNRRLTGDPGSTAAHAIDGNPATAWTSPFSNAVGSTLHLPLDASSPTSSLSLHQPMDDRHSTITRVTVMLSGTTTTVDVPAPDGSGTSTISFPAASASSVTLTIDGIAARTTTDRRYGEPTVLPVAISEVEAPTIASGRPATPLPDCRDDLVLLDGKPLPVRVDAAALTQLVDGESIDVPTCDGAPVELGVGEHRLTTAAGLDTGLDVDRVVLRNGAPAFGGTSNPTVTVTRTRTTRTATVANCPTGCWLILGEGYNDGWQASVDGRSLGTPRQIDGGFNGWWLPASSGAVTVSMRWTPQRTMWIGLTLAGLAVVACAVLVWRARRKGDVPKFAAPTLEWPVRTVPWRDSVVVGAALAVLAALCISPKYGAIAAVLGAAIAALRRPMLAGILSLLAVAGCAAVILRRQVRYHLAANPSWPAAFDDLHRAGLLAVVLLLAATLADRCPPEELEQLT